jgi:hypothetical protein
VKRSSGSGLDDALGSLEAAWEEFARSASLGDLMAAERWAECAFGLWGALGSVDPSNKGWSARMVLALIGDCQEQGVHIPERPDSSSLPCEN